MRKLVSELDRLDRNIYAAIADSSTPTMDEPLRRLSDFANNSKIWFVAATAMGVWGGKQGRRAALSGLVAVGATSALVNQGFKRLAERPRPDREGEDVPEERHVFMPESTSFPSGHSASGFAFATAAGGSLPVVGPLLSSLAAAVAYSRIHAGVHYPGDVVIGSLIGGSVGAFTAWAAQRVMRS